MDNDTFGEEITSKPYPKYQYQAVSIGPKLKEKKAFLEAINGLNLDHIYVLNPLRKNGWCYFCPQKSTLQVQKKEESRFTLSTRVFQLNQQDLIEIPKKGDSKPIRIRGKRIKKWCLNCNKFICQDCWSLYH